MASGDTAIVIPCYNEAATIGAVVAGAVLFGTVYVMDDGSSDASAEIATAAGAVVVPTPGRQGYEQVIELGLRHAFEKGHGFVITIDADGEHDPSLIADFVRAHKGGANLVLGVRPAPQRLAEWLVCKYCLWAFGIRDILCGMKGFSRPVLAAYWESGRPNLVNTWPALVWAVAGGQFVQISITGTQRADKPRFGSIWRANIRIAKMLIPIRALRRNVPSARD